MGYYRGARVGKWVARYRRADAAGNYQETTLAEAEDNADADGSVTAAKLAPTGFHLLRRTYGRRLALRGMPMPVIAKALGNADERITRRH